MEYPELIISVFSLLLVALIAIFLYHSGREKGQERNTDFDGESERAGDYHKVKGSYEVKGDLDGEDYIITGIVNSMVILESKHGRRQVMTGVDSLTTLFKKRAETNVMTDILNSPVSAFTK